MEEFTRKIPRITFHLSVTIPEVRLTGYMVGEGETALFCTILVQPRKIRYNGPLLAVNQIWGMRLLPRKRDRPPLRISV